VKVYHSPPPPKAVVISQDEMNKYLDTVVICPLTSKLHPKWRTRLQIKCAKKNAEIAVDQIRTISKKRLKNNIDKLSPNKSAQLRKLIADITGVRFKFVKLALT
jgi:mRNA interferase MazF